MTLVRNIPPSLDPAIVAEIDARLDAVEREHGVRILFAIESGSRAWGFPSPDSDYDCRFVYVRPIADYLSLFPKRDVIEMPMTPVLDVNGWDLAKALRLLLNGNAVIIEWLMSSIIYSADREQREAFLALAKDVTDRNRVALHYIHLTQQITGKYLSDPADVALKKVFYALRPVMALRWLRRNPRARIAPMNFQELCAGAGLASEVEAVIERMLAEKAVTREMGRGALPPVLGELIRSELEIAEPLFGTTEPVPQRAKDLADRFFRLAIERCAR